MREPRREVEARSEGDTRPRLLIWGAGGHGRVVADVVRAVGGVVEGFVDRDATRLGHEVEPDGTRILFSEMEFMEHLRRFRSCPPPASAVAIAIGDNAARWPARLALGALVAPALVHPRATVSPSAAIGAGSVVCAGSVVNAGARIGEGVIINTGVVVEHDCQIDSGVHLSPRATLCGGVSVGSGSWICAGATVIPGVRIGSGVVVGAGAVVLSDVPAGAVVVGNPARQIIRRSE